MVGLAHVPDLETLDPSGARGRRARHHRRRAPAAARAGRLAGRGVARSRARSWRADEGGRAAGGGVDGRRHRDHRPDAAARRGARAPARDARRRDRRHPAARRARRARHRRHRRARRACSPGGDRAAAERIASARPDGGQPALGGGRACWPPRTRRPRRCAILEEDVAACRAIGEHGREELAGARRILTVCNTGRLATAGCGTALGVVYAKAEAGEPVEVFACETRPLLQGARLTAWELDDAGIPVTVLTDGAAPTLLARGGHRRGDRRLRPGGRQRRHRQQDRHLRAGDRRPPSRRALLRRGAALDAGPRPRRPARRSRSRSATATRSASSPVSRRAREVWNPAFDVTPAELITAIITDAGRAARAVRAAPSRRRSPREGGRLPRGRGGPARGARGAGARPGRGAGRHAGVRHLRQRPHGVVPGVARAARARPRAGGRRRRHRRAARRAAPRDPATACSCTTTCRAGRATTAGAATRRCATPSRRPASTPAGSRS